MDRSRPPALHVNMEAIHGASYGPAAKEAAKGDGVLHLAYLIPRATYKLRVVSQSGVASVKTFKAPQTGELDLGTIRMGQSVNK